MTRVSKKLKPSHDMGKAAPNWVVPLMAGVRNAAGNQMLTSLVVNFPKTDLFCPCFRAVTIARKAQNVPHGEDYSGSDCDLTTCRWAPTDCNTTRGGVGENLIGGTYEGSALKSRRKNAVLIGETSFAFNSVGRRWQRGNG